MTIGTPGNLLTAYARADGAWDEMVDRDGQLRGHWARLGPAFAELGIDELTRRREEAARLLDADGVTYNVYGAPASVDRRWRLDPVPVVLGSDEWVDIEQGVIERAELLDLVLTDLYGARDLLRRDLLPPELVYGHPGFLRACDGVRLPGEQQLFTCAVDLVRDPDGSWVVLGDRAQAPSGAGYALENRVVTSRVLPSLYRDAQVHRLAPFFRTLRSALQEVAPRAAGDPRIVVLTPGPFAETAFEHAYLASSLGYPLVQGSDLTVRNGRVWMRSLGRLEPVDVILRRVDAWFCDPLELRADSELGAPGLVEASRLGSVSIVNTLGSGVLESPALLAFLPAIARHLLGHDLRLPTVEAWWCGDATMRSHVLAHLDRLVLRRVSRGPGPGAVSGWELSASERDALRAEIEARPGTWVGQAAAAPGSSPTLAGGGLEPRATVLRTFAVARLGSYVAMPGGLTRVAGDAGGPVVSNQAGALSKDTWVLSSEPEPLVSFWLQGGPAVAAVEPAASMSSGAGENLFWLGRYAERSEDVVRLLRVVLQRRNEFAHDTTPAGSECLRALLVAVTEVTTTYPGFVGEGSIERLADPGPELVAVAIDGTRPGTLADAVRRMLDAAYAVRDQLSGDTWLVLGNLDRDLLSPGSQGTLGRVTLGRVLHSLLAFAGLGAESMVRDPGWHFMDIGRRLERALQLCALLRATVTTERHVATDSLLFESVLTAAESIITYRRRYRSQAQLETLLDLLLTDAANPRSVVYQLDRLVTDMQVLPGLGRDDRLSSPARSVLEASTQLRLADTARLSRADDDGHRHDLVGLLDEISAALHAAADAVADDHFGHLQPQRTVLLATGPTLPDTGEETMSA